MNKKSGVLIWRTVLYKEIHGGQYDPNLEQDVQWNIACVQKLASDNLVASDKKGRIFLVNRYSGKIVKSPLDSR